MESNKKILLSTIGIAILVVLVSGVTFAFFNYTRTGVSNVIKVGRIYFNTSQNGNINLTNVFPITSEDLGNDTNNHDSVTISITGDTTYSGGIEYLVTLDEVNNTVNNKDIPVKFNVEATNVGDSSSTYYESRGGNSSIYLLEEDGEIKEGKYLLVGYIAPGQTGIDGSIEITAFVDKDKIAISDTYSTLEPNYAPDPNMSNDALNYCINLLTDSWGQEVEGQTEDIGESYEAFCRGTGTNWGDNFEYALNYNWFGQDAINGLIENKVLVDTNPYVGDTTDEWVKGRTVFTTEEWNSFQNNNAISFKVKVEANEGIWVEKEATPGRCFTVETPYKLYAINPNMTQSELNACIDYFSGSSFDDGATAEDYCRGEATTYGSTLFQDINLNNDYMISNLEEMNVITATGEYGIEIIDYDTNCGTDVVIPEHIAASKKTYYPNESLSNEDIAICVNYFTNEIGWNVDTENGETMENFCNGTGTSWGETFQQVIDENYLDNERINYLVEHNIVNYNEEIHNSKVTYIHGVFDGEDTEGAFENKGLTSVIIPDTVILIGDNAFTSNQLTSVIIPNSVKMIHFDAFASNQLTSVIIPDSVTSIYDRAFRNNQLTSITIGNGLTSENIGSDTFSYNQTLSTVNINMKSIHGGGYSSSCHINAFRSMGITTPITITLSENVETIGKCAFYDMQLTEIVIPDGVKTIEEEAFYDNQLTNVVIPNTVESIGQYAFNDNNLSSVTIGNGITDIGHYAFQKYDANAAGNHNYNLSSITIDKPCSVIKNMAGYAWIGPIKKAGTTIYGSNNEVCDSW